MIKLDVCIETVFTDLSCEQRIARIAQLGYDSIEIWHPEGTWNGAEIDESMPKDADTLNQACEDAGVTIVSFVVNAWDGSYGGCPVSAGDKSRFIDQVHKSIDFGKRINCSSAIILPGMVQPNLTREQMRGNMESAFEEGLEIAEANEFTFQIEPLNTPVDHAGFYLDSTAEAIDIVRKFDSPRMKMLYDIYHMQIMEGSIVDTIKSNIDIIGHMHVAGVPGRAEPDNCELNYPYIFKKADEFGYKGYFGLEYFPRLESAESLELQLRMAE